MPLIHITGNAGAGKSTVCKELCNRGYEAFDIDEDSIAGWYDKVTGQPVVWSWDDGVRTKQWFESHAYKISRAKLEQLSNKAKLKPIFICGQSIHDHEVWDLFDSNVYLEVDKPTLKNRLATRTSNDFGKKGAELEAILQVHDSFQAKHREHGAIMIDAHRSIDEVVDEILLKLGLSSGSGRI